MRGYIYWCCYYLLLFIVIIIIIIIIIIVIIIIIGVGLLCIIYILFFCTIIESFKAPSPSPFRSPSGPVMMLLGPQVNQHKL